MDIDTSALFAPIVINGHTVKNRLSVAPMTRVSATRDGRATATTSVSRGVASGRSSPKAFTPIRRSRRATPISPA
jgi:NADH:flavin oxidoreductase / NADH oxidase family